MSARKPYLIGRLFTHKNDDFSCATLFLKRWSHISDRCSHYTIAFCVGTWSYPVKSEHSLSLWVISIIFHWKNGIKRRLCAENLRLGAIILFIYFLFIYLFFGRGWTDGAMRPTRAEKSHLKNANHCTRILEKKRCVHISALRVPSVGHLAREPNVHRALGAVHSLCPGTNAWVPAQNSVMFTTWVPDMWLCT